MGMCTSTSLTSRYVLVSAAAFRALPAAYDVHCCRVQCEGLQSHVNCHSGLSPRIFYSSSKYPFPNPYPCHFKVRLTSKGKREAIKAGIELASRVIPSDETVRFIVSPYWRTIQVGEEGEREERE